jgi:hypothetical protein
VPCSASARAIASAIRASKSSLRWSLMPHIVCVRALSPL